ncbi:hypothetical protein WT27_13015 [Burkholderia territorii]|uniref:Uncharacterized protein n=1 Tax=Burkholderia territorii TaxID=1503055 RepID=A0A105V431_9BURK|nr:hypothetical protein [Burkholderia territorii]KVV40842.1 hypothetical protein WT27_13015 [Burkholderia territorii]KVX33789.1 hypothetical protein WT31_08915 [Burkholderia territorii]
MTDEFKPLSKNQELLAKMRAQSEIDNIKQFGPGGVRRWTDAQVLAALEDAIAYLTPAAETAAAAVANALCSTAQLTSEHDRDLKVIRLVGQLTRARALLR